MNSRVLGDDSSDNGELPLLNRRPVGRFDAYVALSACLVLPILLSRLVIPVGGISIEPGLLVLYGSIVAIALRYGLLLDARALCLSLTFVGWAAVSYFAAIVQGDSARISLSSLFLLATLYLPFSLRLDSISEPEWERSLKRDWLVNLYISFSAVVAGIGIAQYLLQWFISAPWLFNPSALLPPALDGAAAYNSTIVVEDGSKANGFFHREPSGYSAAAAFALLLELSAKRRLAYMAVFSAALLFAYSGTGLIILLFALLVGFRPSILPRLLLAFVSLGLVAYVAYDELRIDFFLQRLQEFTEPRASAYLRYVAPFKIVFSPETDGIRLLIGEGPGAIQRLPFGNEAYGTTWAKVAYEYGLVGLGLYCCIIWNALLRTSLHRVPMLTLFLSLLFTGGHLLSAPSVCLIFAIAMGFGNSSNR